MSEVDWQSAESKVFMNQLAFMLHPLSAERRQAFIEGYRSGMQEYEATEALKLQSKVSELEDKLQLEKRAVELLKKAGVRLQSELQSAREVIAMYADSENWRYSSHFHVHVRDCFTGTDLEYPNDDEKLPYAECHGGKRAREWMKNENK